MHFQRLHNQRGEGQGDAAGFKRETSSASSSLDEPGWEETWVITASRLLLGIVYILVFTTGCVILSHLVQAHSERHVFAWAVGGIFVCLAVPLSLHDIHMHILHYHSPLQRYYIRILWMVPVYSVESWFALRFKGQKIYLETAREAYEAWVIFSFFKLMLVFIGTTKKKAIERLETLGKEEAHMMFPFCWITPWTLKQNFIENCSFGVYQYVFVRTFFALLVFVTENLGLYGEGEWSDFGKLYVYQMVFVNISQTWALYCLVLFYHELSSLLEPLNPFGKFVSVKFVIFLSFWQAVVISLLAAAGVIKETLEYTEDDVAKGLQDFLICIEMALAAIIHRRAFSYRDFRDHGPLMEHMKEHGGKKKDARTAMVEMLPMEVVAEVNEGIQNLIPGRKKPGVSESVDDAVIAVEPTAVGSELENTPGVADVVSSPHVHVREEEYGVVVAHQ